MKSSEDILNALRAGEKVTSEDIIGGQSKARTVAQWNKFSQETNRGTTREFLAEYSDFMYNKDNVRNCDYCPMNYSFKSSLPCGQQNCWVVCHVRRI